MPEIKFVPVTTIDKTSGTAHIRVDEVVASGAIRRTLVDERCNLDQAGEYARLREGDLPDIEIARYCKFCFPSRG